MALTYYSFHTINVSWKKNEKQKERKKEKKKTGEREGGGGAERRERIARRTKCKRTRTRATPSVHAVSAASSSNGDVGQPRGDREGVPEGRRGSTGTAERQSRCAHLGQRRNGACAMRTPGRSPLTKLLTFRHPVAARLSSY